MHLDHVAIACKDSERMRAWYEDVLGFEVRASKSPSRPDSSGATYLVAPPGSSGAIELMPDDGKPAPTRQPFTGGLSHVALAVDDFTRWESRLTSRGVQWMGLAVEAVGGGRLRSFTDPEGNMLQIVERRAPP